MNLEPGTQLTLSLGTLTLILATCWKVLFALGKWRDAEAMAKARIHELETSLAEAKGELKALETRIFAVESSGQRVDVSLAEIKTHLLHIMRRMNISPEPQNHG